MRTIVEPIDIIEIIFVGLLKSENVELSIILRALCDACFNEGVLAEDVSEDKIVGLSEAFDHCINAARLMEGGE